MTRGWMLPFMAMLLLAGCQSPEPDDGVLRVGLAQMPVSLDPRFATDAASMRVQQFVHRGLVRLDDHFRPVADLARRWTHPSPLEWFFLLRPGVRFHDGRPVTAADVAATLNSVLDPQQGSPLRGGFAAVASVEATGEYTLRLHLSRPDASLLTRLNIGILPADLARQAQHARRTIGCGPFRLSRWDTSTLELARVHEQPMAVNRIRFVGVKDPVTRVLKISRGELDFIQNDLPPHLLPYLRRQNNLDIRTRPSTSFSYIGLNLQDHYLKDIRVRRALALALDRRSLKRALFADLPELAETVLTSSHWATVPLPATPFDPVRAAALLDQAGFPADSHGIRFSLTYRTSTDPTRVRLATAIASMWRDIGVQVRVETLEWGGFYARIKRGDFQVFSLSWVGITDPDIYRWILHSQMWPPKGANRGRYADAETDRWLDLAAASEDVTVRRILYEKIERRMQRQMIYIPLWYEPVVAVSGPRVRGFVPAPDGSLLGLADVRLLSAGAGG